MITLHYCQMSDGTSVMCICSTGRDHDESEFDQPEGSADDSA